MSQPGNFYVDIRSEYFCAMKEMYYNALSNSPDHHLPCHCVLLVPGYGQEAEVVVGDQLASHHVLLPDKLFTEQLRVLIPDHPGRRLATHHYAAKLHLTTLPVGPSIEIQHSPGVVQDLRHTRPHNHPQVDPLRPRLRGGEVNPASETQV